MEVALYVQWMGSGTDALAIRKQDSSATNLSGFEGRG